MDAALPGSPERTRRPETPARRSWLVHPTRPPCFGASADDARFVERKKRDDTNRYRACYRDPEDRIRSAGTHSARRAAERAGNREEQMVLAGS